MFPFTQRFFVINSYFRIARSRLRDNPEVSKLCQAYFANLFYHAWNNFWCTAWFEPSDEDKKFMKRTVSHCASRPWLFIGYICKQFFLSFLKKGLLKWREIIVLCLSIQAHQQLPFNSIYVEHDIYFNYPLGFVSVRDLQKDVCSTILISVEHRPMSGCKPRL